MQRLFLSRAHERRFRLSAFLQNGAAANDAARPSALGGRLGGLVGGVYAGIGSWVVAHEHGGRIHLNRPVVSVGNLSLGGSGKTPLVRWVAERLRERHKTVAVLTRGYGWIRAADEPRVVPPHLGRQGDPDEALLLARDGVAVGAHPNRARGAASLSRSGVKPDLYLLDDGFQHRGLHRDWDVVLLDRRDLVWPRRPLPAGVRREPWSSLGRANRIVITGLGEDEAAELSRRSNEALGLPGTELPILVGLRAVGTVELGEWWRGASPIARPRGGERAQDSQYSVGVARPAPPMGRVVAFSGIAYPPSFERLLEEEGLPIESHVVFPDHHRYTAAELARLGDLAGPSGTLLTTEKDAARVPPGTFAAGLCHVVAVRPVFWRGKELLLADLERLMRLEEGGSEPASSGDRESPLDVPAG